MKTKTISYLVAIFIFCTSNQSSFAQTYLKFYTTFNSEVNDLSVFSVAAAKTIKKNKQLELEINFPYAYNRTTRYANIDSGTVSYYDLKTSLTDLKMRIEYVKTILGEMAPGKKAFSFGNSIQLYYKNASSKSSQSNIFPLASAKLGINYQLIPKINFNYKKHFGFQMDMPINIICLGRVSQSVENTNLPLAQRTWSIFDMDAGPSSKFLSLRLGVVYSL